MIRETQGTINEYGLFLIDLLGILADKTVEMNMYDDVSRYAVSLRGLNLSDDEMLIRMDAFNDARFDQITDEAYAVAAQRMRPLAQIIGPTLYSPQKLQNCGWVYGIEIIVMNFGRFIPGVTSLDTEVAMAYVCQKHEQLCRNPHWHTDD